MPGIGIRLRTTHATQVANKVYEAFKAIDDESLTKPLKHTKEAFELAYSNALVGYLSNQYGIEPLSYSEANLETNLAMLDEVYHNASVRLGGVLQDSPDVIHKTAKLLKNNVTKAIKLLDILNPQSPESAHSEDDHRYEILFGGGIDIDTVSDNIRTYLPRLSPNGKYEILRTNYKTTLFDQAKEDVMYEAYSTVDEYYNGNSRKLHESLVLTEDLIKDNYSEAIKLLYVYDVLYRTKDMSQGDKDVIYIRMLLLARTLDYFIKRVKLSIKAKLLVVFKEAGVSYVDYSTFMKIRKEYDDVTDAIKYLAITPHIWKTTKAFNNIDTLKKLSGLYNVILAERYEDTLVDDAKKAVREIVKKVNNVFGIDMRLGDIDYKDLKHGVHNIPNDVIIGIANNISQPVGLVVETLIASKMMLYKDNQTAVLLAIARLLAKVTSRELIIKE